MSSLLDLWLGSDPTAHKQDGVKTTLATSYPAGTGSVSISLVDGSDFPLSNCAVSVVDPANPQDVKEILTGWTRTGNTLTSCTRKYDNRVLNANDIVVVGMNSEVYGAIVSDLESLLVSYQLEHELDADDEIDGMHKTITQAVDAATVLGGNNFTLLHEGVNADSDSKIRVYAMSVIDKDDRIVDSLLFMQNGEITNRSGDVVKDTVGHTHGFIVGETAVLVFGHYDASSTNFNFSSFRNILTTGHDGENLEDVLFACGMRVDRPSSSGNPEYGVTGVTVSTAVAHSRIGTASDPWSSVTTDALHTDAVTLSTTGTGPSITQGSAEPSSTPEDGSIYLRTDGTTWQYTTAEGWARVGADGSAACAPEVNGCLIADNGDGTLSVTWGDFRDSHGNQRAGYGFVDGTWTAAVPGAKTVEWDPNAGTIDGVDIETANPLPTALSALGYTQAAIPDGETVYGAILCDRVTGNVYFCRNCTGGADGDRPEQLELDVIASSTASNPIVMRADDSSTSKRKSHAFRIRNYYRAPMHVSKLYKLYGNSGTDCTAKLEICSVDSGTGYPDATLYTSGEVTVTAQADGYYPDGLFDFTADAIIDPGESVWFVLTRTDTGAFDWTLGTTAVSAYKCAGGWLPEGSASAYIKNGAGETWYSDTGTLQLGCQILISRDGCFTIPADVYTPATKTLDSQFRILSAFGPITEDTEPSFVFCGMEDEIYADRLSLSAGECAVAIYPPDGAEVYESVLDDAAVAPFTSTNFDPVLWTLRGLARRIVIQTRAADTVNIAEHSFYTGGRILIDNDAGATITLGTGKRGFSESTALANTDVAEFSSVRTAEGDESLIFRGRKS